MEIKDVFDAAPKSTWQFTCETGQGFYIPAYQRQYSWADSNIDKLIADVCHGLNQLVERKDAITFIGTIIAIHDTEYTTVSPIHRPDVPSKVMTIIDGQQRLTTLLLINTILHNELKKRAEKFDKKQEPQFRWIANEAKKVIAKLGKTFEEDMAYGDGDYQYYPRMIRAYEDAWSREQAKAIYVSPMARYLFLYGKHTRNSTELFTYPVPENDEDKDNRHSFLSEKHRHICKVIRSSLAKGGSENTEFPTFNDIFGSKDFQSILLNSEIPDEVKQYVIDNQSGPSKVTQFHELLRIIFLANFILNRIAITIVTANNEDYAFDMFEALNTTGEPLTAFETFKPKVIQAEELEKYEKSESRKHLLIVENHLEGYNTATEKQTATTNLLIPFRLAENGQKLSKRLNDQRRFLKEAYEQLPDLTERRNFTQHLAHIAVFMEHAWPSEKDRRPSLNMEEIETDDVILCLDMLRSSNHSITIGLLARYYSQVRCASSEHRQFAIDELRKAVKAISAFSILWRSANRGTANIDEQYRQLLREGCEEVGMSPLARHINGSSYEVPHVSQLCEALKFKLKNDGEIKTKEDWVKRVSAIPAYKNQSQMTKFILLAAAHDAIPDEQEPGLIKYGKAQFYPTLTYQFWKNLTLEHIAPQKPTNGWGNEIYEDQEQIHKLGNLTLIPKIENASIGNRDWKTKKLFFEILSGHSIDELETLLEEAQKDGIDLSASTQELLSKSPFQPLAKGIASYSGDWCNELIDKRSKRVAELAWEQITPWLDNWKIEN